tara:strand:- start:3846 stop:5744 length:1899 start_codon:yes stop_codon:yes gene_type:complete
MAAEKVVLEFEANLAGMQQALASIPGMTEKEAKEAVRQLRKSFLTAEKAAKKAAKVQGKSFKKAAKEIDESAEKTGEGLKRMAQAVGGKTGEMAGRVEALGQSVAALATPLGAGTAAAVAMTAAVTGLAAGMVAAVFAADDFIDDLKELQGLEGFELLPADQVEAIENVNGSLDAIGAIAKQATVVLAGEFAPAMEQAAVAVVALNLAMLDGIRQVADAVDLFQVLGDAMIDGLMGPIDLVVAGLAGMVKALALVAEAAGQDELAGKLTDATTAMAQLRKQLTTAGLLEAASLTLDLADSTGNYTDRARELIGTLDELDTTQKSVQTSTKDLGAEIDAITEKSLASFQKALEAEQKALEQVAAIGTAARASQFTAEQKLTTEYGNQLAALQELSEAYPENLAIQQEAAEARLAVETDYHQKLQAMAEQTAEKERDLRRQEFEDRLAVASSAIATADMVAQNRLDNMDKTTDAGRAEAERMFRIQKAIAMVGVLIDGAAATVKAFAQFGPPPSPVGIAAAVAAGAATTASLAMIAAQKPEFPMGGIVPSIDHQLISAQPGEAVLNRQAVNRLGPSGIDALNNGRGGVGEVVVVNRYEHRMFDAFMADHLAQGGPLVNALNRRSGPPGHSRRRR